MEDERREEGRGRREEKKNEKLKTCKVAQLSGLPLHRLSGPTGMCFPFPMELPEMRVKSASHRPSLPLASHSRVNHLLLLLKLLL